MLQVIIFRGKTLDTHLWIFGQFFELNDVAYIIEPECDTAIAVDRNTVGQFTGAVDRDSILIFAGDIVNMFPSEHSQYSHTVRGVVTWSSFFQNGFFCFHGLLAQHNPLDCESYSEVSPLVGEYIEIAGNVYDQSYLLQTV